MNLLARLFGGSTPSAQPVQEPTPVSVLPPVTSTFKMDSYEDASKVIEQMLPDLLKVGGSAYSVIRNIPGHKKPHEGTLRSLKIDDVNGYIEGTIRASDEGDVVARIEFRPGASSAIRMGLQELVDYYSSNYSK